MGDYNIDLLNPARHNTEKFINVLQSNGFYPHINQPTRISNESQTLIDNIFSNVYQSSINGIIYSDISDHLPIFVICKQFSYQNSTPKIPKSHRKESQENIDSLNIDLANEVWLEVFSESDVNKC